MARQEFLDKLVLRLREEGAERLVAEDANYYHGYVEGGVAKGRREEEVLPEFGNLMLITRSILDVAGYRVDDVPDQNPSGDLGEDADDYYRTQSEERERQKDRNIHVEVRQVNFRIAGILFLLSAMPLVLTVLGSIGFIIWTAFTILTLLLPSFMYRTLVQFFQR